MKKDFYIMAFLKKYNLNYKSFILNLIFWIPYTFIFFMYLFIGDKTAFGEFITIWPSLLYLFLLIPLSLIFILFKKYKPFLISLCAIMIFIACSEEWRSVFRFPDKEKTAQFESLKKANSENNPEIKAFRILTWNTSGADMLQVLSIIEKYEPDICFFQESRNISDEKKEEILTGYWQGFDFQYAGDCAILSRYKMNPEKSGTVGPWADPQIVSIEKGNSEKIILCNVRLMLPSLVLNPFSKSDREKLFRDNEDRKKQFKNLLDLLSKFDGSEIVLGGDFNSPAICKSTSVLNRDYPDVWKTAGRGWGRTITSDFPVSRIDQIRISSGLECINAEVVFSPLSDHRFLVSDIILENLD